MSDFKLIAIDGKSGSGKTSLAKGLAKIIDCNVFHMDDFFLTPDLRTQDRLNEIGGNVDYIRFENEVLKKIIAQESFRYQKFSCSDFSMEESEEIFPKKINIVEGCYSMHPSLTNYYNFKIFMDVDFQLQKERILKREGSEKLNRFLEEWIPKENLYFQTFNIKDSSDLIINNNEYICTDIKKYLI